MKKLLLALEYAHRNSYCVIRCELDDSRMEIGHFDEDTNKNELRKDQNKHRQMTIKLCNTDRPNSLVSQLIVYLCGAPFFAYQLNVEQTSSSEY